MAVYEVSINRWACNKGHFIAERAITSEDHLDPGSYYGVSSTITGDCKICGLVDDPHLVQIGTHQIEVEDL